MADAYSAWDVCRLSFNGTDSSTTFTDELGHTFVQNTGVAAVLSTTAPKYGTASLSLNATANGGIKSNSPDWNISTGDFCFDFYFKHNTSFGNRTQRICSIYDIVTGLSQFAIVWTFGSGGTITCYYTSGGGNTNLVSFTTTAGTADTWYHVACTRSGTNFYVFLDGVLIATLALTATLDGTPANLQLNIGQNESSIASGTFWGNIDNFRLCKAARYITNFTPPAGNFDPGTFPVYKNADRVLETVTTVGTGTYTLNGAVNGYRAFSAGCADSDYVDYYVEEFTNGAASGAWEVGQGIYSNNTIARNTIYSSSNSNAPVSWSAGTKRIALGLTANRVNLVSVRTAKYSFSGLISAGTGQFRWYPDTNITLTGAYLSVGTAPTGSNTQLVIKKNGTEILNGGYVTVLAGTNLGAKFSLNVTMLTTDYLTVDVNTSGGAKDGLLTIQYR